LKGILRIVSATARRPRYSVLDNYHLRLLGLDDMRPWQEALADYLREKGHLKREIHGD
jgi:dTDP-4-dehydrorhamnose reductase